MSAPAALALEAGSVGHDGARGRLVAEADAADDLDARHVLACAHGRLKCMFEYTILVVRWALASQTGAQS